MKTYQTPMLVWQNVDLADILTESPTSTLFNNTTPGSDNPNTLEWW